MMGISKFYRTKLLKKVLIKMFTFSRLSKHVCCIYAVKLWYVLLQFCINTLYKIHIWNALIIYPPSSGGRGIFFLNPPGSRPGHAGGLF